MNQSGWAVCWWSFILWFLTSHASPRGYHSCIITQHFLAPISAEGLQSTHLFGGVILSPLCSHLLRIAASLELDICYERFKSSLARWIIWVWMFWLSTFVLVIWDVENKVRKFQLEIKNPAGKTSHAVYWICYACFNKYHVCSIKMMIAEISDASLSL